jgi:hypothetical protein
VTGAAEDNPGYDGTIDFGGGALALVSLKDFDPCRQVIAPLGYGYG